MNPVRGRRASRRRASNQRAASVKSALRRRSAACRTSSRESRCPARTSTASDCAPGPSSTASIREVDAIRAIRRGLREKHGAEAVRDVERRIERRRQIQQRVQQVEPVGRALRTCDRGRNAESRASSRRRPRARRRRASRDRRCGRWSGTGRASDLATDRAHRPRAAPPRTGRIRRRAGRPRAIFIGIPGAKTARRRRPRPPWNRPARTAAARARATAGMKWPCTMSVLMSNTENAGTIQPMADTTGTSRRFDEVAEMAQLLALEPGDPDAEREDERHQGARRKRREAQRDRRHERQLAEDERNREEQRRIGRRRLPRLPHVLRRHPAHDTRASRRTRPSSAPTFTHTVSSSPRYLPTTNSQRGSGLASRLWMLRRSISRETRPIPMNTEIRRPATSIVAQTEILDDLEVLARRDLTNQQRRTDQHQRERDDAVEHAIAHALLEDVPGDEADAGEHGRVLGFWGSGVLGFWGSGVLRFWGARVLRFWRLGTR